MVSSQIKGRSSEIHENYTSMKSITPKNLANS
jgi:hypothetical protein